MRECKFFHHYMMEQRVHLEKAIDEDKWYLSEREGRDVGYDRAVRNFCSQHLDRFAHGFRLRFCREVCPGRTACELAETVEEMPSHRQIHERICRSNSGQR